MSLSHLLGISERTGRWSGYGGSGSGDNPPLDSAVFLFKHISTCRLNGSQDRRLPLRIKRLGDSPPAGQRLDEVALLL